MIAFLLSPSALASPREQARHIINDARVERGCPPLRSTSDRLIQQARAWSRKMADDGYISHSVLEAGRWRKVGEVVGVGSKWRLILDALFASPEHRRIMLDCEYDVVALGFYFNDLAWLTGRFYAR